MLTEQSNGFIEYCKVSGFKNKFIQALTIRLNDFNDFLKAKRFSHIQNITYRHLSTTISCLIAPNFTSHCGVRLG